MMRLSDETRRIWTAPTVIAVAITVSLLTALVAEGVWDGLAALILFLTLAYSVGLGLLRNEHRCGRRS